MRGKKTPEHLIDEIRQLRLSYRPAEIVRIMKGRLSRRSIYRALQRLKKEDEIRRRELAEQTRRALEREEAERIRRARMRGAVRFTNVSQVAPNLRKVRSA